MDRMKSDSEKPTLRKWRFGLTPQDSLEEVIDRIPPQSKRFFKLADKELEKVGAFWGDRMEQALARFEELSQQWEELASTDYLSLLAPTRPLTEWSFSASDHKKAYQASQSVELHAPKALKSVLPKHAHSIPGSNLVRRTFAKSPGPSSTSPEVEDDASATQKGAPEMERDNSNAKQRAALNHGRPEEYTQARSKLKLASELFLLTVLQCASLLISFCFISVRILSIPRDAQKLPRIESHGVRKGQSRHCCVFPGTITEDEPLRFQGAKKFEKVTSIPCGIQYKPKIENSDFVSGPELEELIRKTEDAFADVFEHGSRKKALERLRDFGKKQNHHFAAWRAGMWMGAGLPLMIQGLVISESRPLEPHKPHN